MSNCTKMRILATFCIILSVSVVYRLCIIYYYTRQQTTACLTCSNSDKAPASSVQPAMKGIADGIWTLDSGGRLGNQMCDYASLYALAKLNGHQAYILPKMFDFLAPLFKITLPLLPNQVAQNIHWINYPLDMSMHDQHKQIEGKYIKFGGYPFSYKYYDDFRDEIRKEFTFHEFIRKEAQDYLFKVKSSRKNVTFIGVHVRRGDIAAHITRRWRGVIADKAYMDKAIGYFRKKYHEPVFVVVSNDMQWCKENINASNGDVYFSGDGIESSPQKDFALLAHCNHSIMTVGTFGIWSSFLAGGETVYLANFSLPGSKTQTYPSDQMYRPEWIGVTGDLSPKKP
ncbi:galactoside alpha-(1,2)-fucosyltransferase 2-like [Ambystoma mexicanum]|uniref:galactoside alpha-(1,2)-fucosyltransferase 2-like n=1 Tax=Ambystoma mexicanum TaxID=8296 RepID=UPI0037E93FC3